MLIEHSSDLSTRRFCYNLFLILYMQNFAKQIAGYREEDDLLKDVF
jgi:hypothetical protein